MESGQGDLVMSRTRLFATPLLITLSWGAQAAAPRLETEKPQEQSKPECTAQTRGKLWPEKTGHGAATPVEICAPHGWHYRWEQLTVDVSQLKAAVEDEEKKVAASIPAVPATAVIVGKRGANR